MRTVPDPVSLSFRSPQNSQHEARIGYSAATPRAILSGKGQRNILLPFCGFRKVGSAAGLAMPVRSHHSAGKEKMLHRYICAGFVCGTFLVIAPVAFGAPILGGSYSISTDARLFISGDPHSVSNAPWHIDPDTPRLLQVDDGFSSSNALGLATADVRVRGAAVGGDPVNPPKVGARVQATADSSGVPGAQASAFGTAQGDVSDTVQAGVYLMNVNGDVLRENGEPVLDPAYAGQSLTYKFQVGTDGLVNSNGDGLTSFASVSWNVFAKGNRLLPSNAAPESYAAGGNKQLILLGTHTPYETACAQGQLIDISIQLSVIGVANAIGNTWHVSSEALFLSTLKWEGVTEVTDTTTGQPVPLDKFFLFGSDGYDWSHLTAVPEPTFACWMAPSLALLIARRRAPRLQDPSRR